MPERVRHDGYATGMGRNESGMKEEAGKRMAYTPQPAEETHVLVVIELDGLTLRYADANLSMSDGNYYEGRAEVQQLHRAFGSVTEPKQNESMLTVVLKDPDRTVRALAGSYVWGMRRVKVYAGAGRDISNYTLDFDGLVKFPGGITYDDRAVTVRLRDRRNSEWVMLPVNKFWSTTYPNLADSASGTPIPIVYGDWSDTAIPAICVDTTVNEFKIADHAIYDITQVYRNGAAVSHTNEDLTNATFRIANYDPLTDVVTVKMKGRVDDGGNLITHPVDVLTDIQEKYAGIAAADIDTASYAALKAEMGAMKVRSYLSEERSSNTIINELANECTFDVFVSDGLYTVRGREPSQQYDTVFDETNIARGSFAVEYDPEGLYANRIKGSYAYNPSTGGYAGHSQEDNVPAQTQLGQVVSRTMTFRWLYEETDAETAMQRELLLYSQEVRTVRFTGLGEGILVGIGDRAALTYGDFDLRPLHVRAVDKRYGRRSCDVTADDTFSYARPGYITADDAPNYADATDDQRAAQGFFTDDDGYAEPGAEESACSHVW